MAGNPPATPRPASGPGDGAPLSVVCPVHDTPPDLLEAAAASVLGPAGDEVLELILADDGSTDAGTRAALERLAASDGRVRVLRGAGNAGPGSTRNLAIRAANGTWIGFLDSDDLWLPQRAGLLRAVLARHPDAGWIAGNHLLLGPDGSTRPAVPTPRDFPGHEPAGGGDALCQGPGFTAWLINNFATHLGASLFRRDRLLRTGLFREGMFLGEDALLVLVHSTTNALVHVDAPLYAYRQGLPSLMSSPRRLRLGHVELYAAAAREPALQPFRREIRWALYGAEKGRALNNLRAGHRLRGALYALRALARDPRELRDFLLFARLWLRGDAAGEGHRYSRAAPVTVAAPRAGGDSP